VVAVSRTVFSTPRAAEFLEQRALQTQTGQPADRFGDVVVKELLDNALDAAESAGAMPEVAITRTVTDDLQLITVTDNGAGMPAEVVARILDFNVLVSDKSAYRSPTRGQQGNAWKTLLGIAQIWTTEPVVIEACGVRHEVAVSIDPAGNVVARHDQSPSARTTGTSVTMPLPTQLGVDIGHWARAFAVVSPHATISYLANSADPQTRVSYKATATDSWSKPLPGDPLRPHWYDEAALTKLVFAHIGAARTGGRDLPLGEFVRTFAGLSSTAKAKAVKAAVPRVEYLSDFETEPAAIAALLAAMKTATRVPKPTVLGEVDQDHYRTCLDSWYGVERFWFKRKRLTHDDVPWLLEVAVAVTHFPGLDHPAGRGPRP
jgi:DNA topoisomerase VI subunit B